SRRAVSSTRSAARATATARPRATTPITSPPTPTGRTRWWRRAADRARQRSGRGRAAPRSTRPALAARCAPVGAERPAVAFRVAGGEVTRAVVRLVQAVQDLGSGRAGAGEQPVGVGGDHVGAEAAGPVRELVIARRRGRAEHDAAAFRPGQLGVVHLVSF